METMSPATKVFEVLSMRMTSLKSRLPAVYAFVAFVFTMNGLIYSGKTSVRSFVESLSNYWIGAIYVLMFFAFVFHGEIWNLLFKNSRNGS